MGDLPIFVAHDSADVWARRELFRLDADGQPTVLAGVPPDYFSATGQLWGNPALSLGRTRADRLRLVDRSLPRAADARRSRPHRSLPRLRGVVGGARATRRPPCDGEWVKGPGAALFEAVQPALGLEPLPFVAENLGVITPEVEALREQFGFPGMAILQFAFGTDPQAPDFKPHNYARNLVVYTGTHDNDTTVGWWTGDVGHSTRSDADIASERELRPPLPRLRRTEASALGLHPRGRWRRSPTRRSSRRKTCWVSGAKRA